MPTALGVNDDVLHYEVSGAGPWLMLGYPFAGLGLEPVPDLPDAFLAQLTDHFRVIVVDYPRGVGRSAAPSPDVMTVDNVCTELLDVATAAGADRFAYWGYSWGAVAGLQLASRTSRLTALVVGGWPPLGGPYDDMRAMTAQAAADRSLPGQVLGMVQGWDVFYRSMKGWDETALQAITCPRMCYVGADDVVVQHGVTVGVTELIAARAAELQLQEWAIEVLPGLDHGGAMTNADAVVPSVRAFLQNALGNEPTTS